jgi:phosphoglycerol transferase MdoB-like AlkP superfamily enzyme
VGAAEAPESGHALRGACLLAVLLAARTVTLSGHYLPLSIWSPFAYLWQDVLVAVLFFAVDSRLKRPRVAWPLYAALVGYIALNVPVTRVLSTPLTWTMWRAARGPLADAVLHYATLPNLVALAIPLAVGVVMPLALARSRIQPGPLVIAAALHVVAIGPVASARVDTRGFHRNAFGALAATSVSRLAAAGGADDWRVSPDGTPGEDLSPLRGSMRGRNVVLVILESTGARHLGLYGGTPDPAPNLTALARQAIVFERAYAVYPESIKGLFATLCSRYPAFDTAPEIYADVPCASLAATLGAAGYRTALFHSGRFMYLGMTSVIDDRGFDVMEDAGPIGGRFDSSFGVDDASTAARVLRWIDSLQGAGPFFVTYLPTAGHNPYVTNVPGPFRSDQDFWRYMNALHEGDAALGALIEGLRARHLDSRTLFIVFGDHGEAFGEHPGNFAHTLFIHEENVRVPYVIAAPGTTRGQTRVNRIASTIDTAPTILDLLGLPAEAAHQGGSLLRPEPRMALFYTDYALGWLGVADGCWKYLYEIDSRRSRLFDVCVDPGETRDRAGDFADRATGYRERVLAWAAAQKDRVERRK